MISGGGGEAAWGLGESITIFGRRSKRSVEVGCEKVRWQMVNTTPNARFTSERVHLTVNTPVANTASHVTYIVGIYRESSGRGRLFSGATMIAWESRSFQNAFIPRCFSCPTACGTYTHHFLSATQHLADGSGSNTVTVVSL